MTKEEILSAIENLTVLELSELVKAAEEKFGVSAAAPVKEGVSKADAEEIKGKLEAAGATVELK